MPYTEAFMRQFYLHQRYSGIFYAELINPATGAKMNARSTGKRTRDEALITVAGWLKNGLPSGKTLKPFEDIARLDTLLQAIDKAQLTSDDALRIAAHLRKRGLIETPAVNPNNGASQLFIPFLLDFWNFDSSPYVKDKRTHGQRIGKRHCYECSNGVKRYWEPEFAGKKLGDITRGSLKDFSLSLSDKGLSFSTVNKAMNCGTTPLLWAFHEGIIPLDPTAGLSRFSGGSKKRGALTPSEAQAVFAVHWDDPRSFAGNLLSITTGLREGEILALRHQDIGGKILLVRNSWSYMEGLKETKNGIERRVPLLPEVKQALLEVIRDNPYPAAARPFIFYGLTPDEPMKPRILLEGLKKACRAAGIDALGRGIVFHSHRHYYAARMTDKLEAEKVCRITGHKSKAVFDEYADHIIEENLEEAAAAGREVFSNILLKRQSAGVSAG
jgi:integrase